MASDSQHRTKEKRDRPQRQKWAEEGDHDSDRSRSKRDKADRRAREQARRLKEKGGDA